ncbi:MAG: AmmeMemoRadiSam system protein B, partial [Candidatus Margulisbacteria bacterium]|nr:AmmeMemoRadiSam system protein B [Candidatus Margulisiibacteriota bacterium]
MSKVKNKVIFIFILLLVDGIGSAKIANVKEPNVAGSFYPGEKKQLYSTIIRFLKNVPKADIKKTPWAIIAPHAGYMYSGQTAAYAYKQLEETKIRAPIDGKVIESYVH